MSKGRDTYLRHLRSGFFGIGNGEAFAKLVESASVWRSEGQHFSAGHAMSRAVHAAWGDPDRMAEAQYAALNDFNLALRQSAPGSLETIAALHKLRGELQQMLWLFDGDTPPIRTNIRQLEEELGQQLLTHFSTSPFADNYLVKGFELSTDLDGHWEARHPDFEISVGMESYGERLILNIASAFHLFVGRGDWQGAKDVVERRPSAFTSPGLKGWRAVTNAHVNPQSAVEWFDQAADAFAADIHPSTEEMIASGRAWSGINTQLWTKYFRARARLLESIRTPEKVEMLLAQASEELKGTESGWHNPDAARFRILINVLTKLTSVPPSLTADSAENEYLLETRISPNADYDQFALRFITEAADALQGYAVDPVAELTRDRLATAVESLARVPIIGPEVASAIRPALGQTALRALLGPTRTWMHRTLESITDEAKFRRILLRLLQARLPLYSQVRHGPLEYGKDIVSMVQIDAAPTLQLYQVKCGDIDKRKWRESQHELEEMFLIPMSTFQLPIEPVSVEAFLVTNGHANTFVEPVMEAWFDEQLLTHGRRFTFLHLDRLVSWMVNDRLITELKLALEECGVRIEHP